MKRFIMFSLAAFLATQSVAQAPPRGPTLDQALTALQAANAQAREMGVNLTCAVVDARGDVVAVTRMTGTAFFTLAVAEGKALVSALFGQPSANMSEFANNPIFPSLNARTNDRMFPIRGAVPIRSGNQVIGGIGCSGATGEQDEIAAIAGQQAIQ